MWWTDGFSVTFLAVGRAVGIHGISRTATIHGNSCMECVR